MRKGLSVVVTKSPDLEFYASMRAVDVGEKLASVRFELLNMAH